MRKAGLRPTQMAWHPEKQLIAVGWSNGDATLWSREEQDGSVSSILILQLTQKMFPSDATTAVPNAPVGSIECIAWSSNGLKLLLADAVS